MPTWLIILLSVLGVILVALIVLIILGKRMQKKQAASESQIEAASQIVSLLVIGKGKMRAKDSNLPKIVTDQIPKHLALAKLPIVTAKVGPKVMQLIADAKIFDDIPVKTEIKCKVSGIYITEIKSVRGKAVVNDKKKKKSFTKRLAAKADALKKETADNGKKKKK